MSTNSRATDSPLPVAHPKPAVLLTESSESEPSLLTENPRAILLSDRPASPFVTMPEGGSDQLAPLALHRNSSSDQKHFGKMTTSASAVSLRALAAGHAHGHAHDSKMKEKVLRDRNDQ